MKLSLEELKVESYASQVSETELTAVKGGSSAPCGIYVLGAALVTGVVAITNNLIDKANDHEECGEMTKVYVDECGNTTTFVVHDCYE